MAKPRVTAFEGLERRVLDNLNIGVQIIDASFRYLYVNEAAAKHGHTNREHLVGRTMMEAYPGIENTPLFDILRTCMRDRSSHQLQNEFAFPDGVRGWFEISLEPVPEGLLVLSSDVAEKKRISETMRRTNRARVILARCNQSLVRASDEQAIAQEICDIVVQTGYRLAWIGLAEKNEAKTVRPIAVAGMDDGYVDKLHVTWDDTSRGRGPTGRAIRSGEVAITKFISKDPDFGPWRNYALTRGLASSISLPMRIEGETAGAINIYAAEPDAFDTDEQDLLMQLAQDIGFGLTVLRARVAHIRAVEELRKKERLLTEAERIAHVGSWSADLEKGNFRWSDETYRIYDVSPDDFILTEDKFLAVIHPEDRSAMQNWIAATLSGKKPGALEHRSLSPSGRIRILRGDGEVELAANGKPIRVVGTVQDITEAKRNEEQLQLAQKMESVGQLAGGVAHDFNNMLAVILSHAEFARESLDKSDPVSEDLEQIRKAAERSATLTRQLLAFSRKQVLEPRLLALDQVATELEKMLRRLIGEDIDLVQVFGPDLGLVRADPGQIEQVIMNLVLNARDAMPRGGNITIEISNVELDEEYAAQHVAVEPGPYVLLTVSDTGCGMSELTQHRLFEPFFTTKEKGRGTGLGLSTVYGIVKQSGGSIAVYSELNRGTTFKVYLPRTFEPPVSMVPSYGPKRLSTGTETILVVEDEEAVRKLVARILRKAGFTVIVAENGNQALATCNTYSDAIHLLLTDVVMPQMSGRELAEQIHETRPNLRTLYMSGYTDNAIVHHGVLDSGAKFISKPFTVTELVRKVRDALDEPTLS